MSRYTQTHVAAVWLARLRYAAAAVLLAGAGACQAQAPWCSLRVTASAYNATAAQTTAEFPALTAWGDTLKPGMKALAVSRDLIKRGLGYGTEVAIEGLPGSYVVRDKMNRRWRQRIDIFMTDRKRARHWGVQAVTIYWRDKRCAGQDVSPPGSAADALR